MQFQKKEKRQTTVRFDSHHVRLRTGEVQSFGGAKGWSCTTYTTWSTTMVYAFSREMYRVITHGKM